MKLGKLLIYLGILVALAAYVYFVEIKQKQEKQATEEKAAKIVQLEKDQIVAVDLQSRDKEKIELKKPSDTWVLTSPIKTKADVAAVGRFSMLSPMQNREDRLGEGREMGRL